MREYGIGQSVPRVEDQRLLTGKGKYTDDRKVPGAAHMAVLRSPMLPPESQASTRLPPQTCPGSFRS